MYTIAIQNLKLAWLICLELMMASNILSLWGDINSAKLVKPAFINAQDSLDNLNGQNVITWGVLTDVIILARMCQLFDGCFVPRAKRISTNRSDEDWHHAPDSCTLEVFRVSPKREFGFYLALFNKNYIFYILKTKSIRAFMNGNNSLRLGL